MECQDFKSAAKITTVVILRIENLPQIEEGMSRASLLVQGTTITTNTFDLTDSIVDSTDNVVDLTTTYNFDHSFDAEVKKDK